jgi:hypothetical protein
VKWRLYAGGLWYEPPVKIKYAKEASEVSDQDRLLEAVHRRDYLLQGPSALIGNIVAEKSHFHCAKNTLGWIQQDTVSLKR